jgi:hypothetical protein
MVLTYDEKLNNAFIQTLLKIYEKNDRFSYGWASITISDYVITSCYPLITAYFVSTKIINSDDSYQDTQHKEIYSLSFYGLFLIQQYIANKIDIKFYINDIDENGEMTFDLILKTTIK